MINRIKTYAVTGALMAAAVIILAGSAAVAAPPGDYGDAPDDISHRFPTRYATTNSRIGRPGAHHLVVGQEVLGTSVSAEIDATDPADPDGMPNLVNQDGHDDGLLGLTFTPIANPGFPFSGRLGGTSQMEATIRITVPAGAPPGPRYMNILVDTNRDQTWRNTGQGKEWVTENHELNITPGTSQNVTFTLDYITTSPPLRNADMWMRATLTRTPLNPLDYGGVGGWDGSGAFQYGETEDYLLFAAANPNTPLYNPPTEPKDCDCFFTVRFDPPVLYLDHTQTGFIDAVIQVKGNGCYAKVQRIYFAGDYQAPIYGNDVLAVVSPTEYQMPSSPGLNDQLISNQVHRMRIPVGPFRVHTSLTQSFSVCLDISGYCNTDKKSWATTACGGVVVFHGANVLTAVMYHGPGIPYQPGLPIPILPPIGPPIGYVTYGPDQLSSGKIYATQVTGIYPPGCPDDKKGEMLKVCSFFDIFTELSIDSVGPEQKTQITALTLNGWTASDVSEAGISDESLLRTGRYPAMPNSFFDIFTEVSTDCALGPITVNPVAHTMTIQNPYGFSYYAVGGPGAQGVPVTLSSLSLE